MNTVKAAGGDAVTDALELSPATLQLPLRKHPMLVRRDLCDGRIPMRSWRLLPAYPEQVANLADLAPFTAGGSARRALLDVLGLDA